jgi:hypothetical protein
MRKPRFSKFLDYLPPVIAFTAALVAVVGSPKWNGEAVGLSKITPLGWLVLAIGAMALTATILVTRRNRREQLQQKQMKERISAIGKKQLLRAIGHVTSPFCISVMWRDKCEVPESPIDLLDTKRRDILSSLDLNADSTCRHGTFEVVKWHSLIESLATRGAYEITTALQIYAAYLSPEIIESTTGLLYSDFFQYRLLRIHDIVDANTHGNPDRPVPFFWAKKEEGYNTDYEEFWQLMATAMTLCGSDSTQHGSPRF